MFSQSRGSTGEGFFQRPNCECVDAAFRRSPLCVRSSTVRKIAALELWSVGVLENALSHHSSTPIILLASRLAAACHSLIGKGHFVQKGSGIDYRPFDVSPSLNRKWGQRTIFADGLTGSGVSNRKWGQRTIFADGFAPPIAIEN